MKKINAQVIKSGIFLESVFEWLMYATLAGRSLLSQYFDSEGFSPVEIGTLMAVTPLILLVASPLWFRVGSKVGNSKVFRILTLVSSLLIWSVFMVDGFIPKLVSLAVFGLFMSAVVPVGEATVIASLKSKNKAFDHVRLWGTVGFGTVAFLLGITVRFGFIYFFALYSISFFAVFSMQKKIAVPAKAKSNGVKETSGEGKLSIFFLMLTGLFFGVSMTAFNSSFFPVLTRELGFDVSTAGIGYSVMAFSEIPFLIFAGRIIKKVGSVNLLVGGIFLTGLKVFLASIAPSMSGMLVIQSIHGVNFIIMYYAMFNYIYFKLPERHLVMAQTIFWMILHGLSYFVGSVIGGMVVESFGIVQAFRSIGFFGMGISLIMAVLFFGMRIRRAH